MKPIGVPLRSFQESLGLRKRRKLEFASAERINAHSELRDDFILRILETEGAFISDESSLWDFHEELTSNALQGRIKAIYGVDVSDIESGRIADIFDRIASVQASRTVSS